METTQRPMRHTIIARRTVGFTLVELLLAMGVLVIAGVWLLGAYHSSLHLAEVSRQHNVALNDLRDMMERIKATPFAQLTNNFPDGAVNGVVGGGAETYSGVIGGYTLANEQITVTHSPTPTADPKELVVQVTWVNRNRTHQRSISTMRASEAS